MNKKLPIFSLLTIAFVAVFLCAAPNETVAASGNCVGAFVCPINLLAANETDNVIRVAVGKDSDRALFDRDFDFPADLVHKMRIGIGAAVRPSDFGIPD